MLVVEDDDGAITRYVERSLGVTIWPPARTFGFMTDDGMPLCAVVFNDFNGSNIELTMVAERMTRGVLRWLANYVFVHAKCRRLTVRARKKDKRSRQAAIRLGFTFESVAKRYFTNDHACVYCMFPETCRWLDNAR